MSLFFVFCHDIIIQSPYFRIVTLDITGNVRLSRQEILDVSRINPDANIFLINLPLAKKRLLSCPWVANAEVTRELPGKLSITIREHQPLAILDLGRKFIINTEGFVFKEVSDNDPLDLPIVYGIDYSDLDFEDIHRSSAYDALLSLLKMGQDPAFILPNQLIQRIRVDREAGITLYLSAPVLTVKINAIKIGYRDYSDKFMRLAKIIDYFKTNNLYQGIDWIDIHQMNRVIISPLFSNPSPDGHKDI